MFINKFKNVIFEEICVHVDFEPADELHKFSFSRKQLNTFPDGKQRI